MAKILNGFLAAGFLALALCGGCGLLSGEKAAAPVPPLSMFTDIPLPPELTIDDKNSQVYEHPVGRVGLLRASGRVDKLAVLSYYREAMIQNGWARDGEFDNGDSQLMVFSKSPRSAAINVSKGWIYTDVEINVSAKK